MKSDNCTVFTFKLPRGYVVGEKMWTLLLCLGVAAAARLDNTYLPPSHAQTSGGNGDFLEIPSGNYNGVDSVSVPAVSQQYGAPLDNTYLPPSTNGQSNGNGNGHFSGAPNGGFNGGHSGYRLRGQDHLNSRYLPPSTRRPINGNGHILSGSNGGVTAAHFGSSSFNEVSSYQAASSLVQPAPVYGPPDRHHANAGADAKAGILRFNNENNGDGNYHFEYETENKISQQEVGQVKDVATEGGVTVVQGTYSYVGDDGQTYTVNYVADENGFRPAGDHIHRDIQANAEEAARSAESNVGYPGQSDDQNGYRY